MEPAARSVAASTQISPAEATIGQSARERRTLIWIVAPSDEIKTRLRGCASIAGPLPAYWRLVEQEAHQHVSVGTPFHPRTSPLNRKMQWREWSGYFASSVYADAHDIEYNAIREAAALTSPLWPPPMTTAS